MVCVCALTLVEFGHVHAAVVHLKGCLQGWEELMQDSRVLQQRRRRGLDRLGALG